jgi:hypothetical protein
MSVSVYTKGYYEDFWRFRAAKKQSQFKANYIRQIERKVDSRLRGNDKQQISVLISVNPV